MNRVFLVVMLVAVLGAGCHSSSTPTTPSAGTPPPAAATITDSFTGVLNVGDTQYFKFTVGVFGTVNVSVASIGGPGVPTTVQTRIGIGTLDDTGCTPTLTAISGPGVIAVTANESAGDFCANIADIGNLVGPANYTLTVAHP